MTKIQDGTGSGKWVKVINDNALYVHGSIENMNLHKAIEEEKYFAVSLSAQATAVADVIGYIKNTSATESIVVDFISVYSSAETQLHVHLGGIGTPVGGADVTPANSTAGSGVQASGTFQSGVDITGLSGTTNTLVTVTPADATKVYKDVPLIIPPNQIATFIAYQNTATIYIGIGFYYYKGD